jgi:hypothetical protein
MSNPSKLSPYLHLVPKNVVENMEWRRKIARDCKDSKENQRGLIEMCKADILFWINTFCWLYEPRPKESASKTPPFITYKYQDKAFLTMNEALGLKDMGIEKSRDLGGTWMFLTLYYYHWLFSPDVSFGLMSRNVDLVDKTQKKDTLFWKLDWHYKHTPKWMQPERQRIYCQMTNLENGASIEGAPTTGDAFRGGRKTSIAPDEFAAFKKGEDVDAQKSMQHATGCRLYVSTPIGDVNEYYNVMHDPSSSLVKIVLDWRDHPKRKIGLYEVKEGRTIPVDIRKNPVPKKYLDKIKDVHDKLRTKGFQVEGVVRSPWYDGECLRPGATPRSIAQELDRDYGGSDYQVFSRALIKSLDDKNSRNCYGQGYIDHDKENFEAEWVESDGGPMKLWCNLTMQDKPPHGNYAIGCDIAAGTGGSYSSNSALVVLDQGTGEQVAGYADNTISPEKFAGLAVSIAKWFNEAYLNFEVNGPLGTSFLNEVLRIGYYNLYRRKIKHVRNKVTNKPGYFADNDNKQLLFSEMRRALESGELLVRDTDVYAELMQYVYRDGNPVHSKALRTEDESSKGKAHGDRAIAMGVAWIANMDRPTANTTGIPAEQSYKDVPWHELPQNTMARRMAEEERDLALVSNSDEAMW